jgi:Transmembrane domain of unknown function (DUF3566)
LSEEAYMTTLKRIGPGSAFKIGLITYAVVGLLLGIFMAAISGLMGSLGGALNQSAAPGAKFFGLGMGFGAIIFFPILYGVIGGVFAALGAVVYNLVAGWVGGLEVDIS